MMNPALNEARERLFEELAEDTSFWRTIFYETFFKPTELLDSIIDSIWKPSPNSIGIHLRTGSEGGWVFHSSADGDEFFTDIAYCVVNRTSLAKSPLNIFIAGDNPSATQAMIEVLTSLFKEKAMEPQFQTGDASGKVEHLTYAQDLASSVPRLFAEFEVFRRVETLFPSNSGFSLMAHVVRQKYENRNFLPYSQCLPLAAELMTH